MVEARVAPRLEFALECLLALKRGQPLDLVGHPDQVKFGFQLGSLLLQLSGVLLQ